MCGLRRKKKKLLQSKRENVGSQAADAMEVQEENVKYIEISELLCAVSTLQAVTTFHSGDQANICWQRVPTK